MIDNDELLDIVDDNDYVIDQMYRSEVYRFGLSTFRAVNAFIVDKQNRLWIPTRSPHKTLFPLCLDTSVGGHVKAGETYEQAFERELYEEVQLRPSDVEYTLLAKLNPSQHYVSAHMQVYLIRTECSPIFNPDDFIDASWISLTDLKEKILQGEKTKGDLPTLVNLVQTFLVLE